jgi:hypothetical protein
MSSEDFIFETDEIDLNNKIPKKMIGGKTISMCVKWIADFIIKNELIFEKHVIFSTNLSDNDIGTRLKNTLIICNHDAFILDFYAIPYVLSKYNIETSVVVHDMFMRENGTVFNKMTEKFKVKLISKNGAVQHIIQHLKQGRSVVIFYDTIQYTMLNKKKSLPFIINATNIKPVFLKYTYSYKFKRLIKGIPIVESINYNIKAFIHLLYKMIKKEKINFHIDVSKNFDSYKELIENKEFIKPIYL